MHKLTESFKSKLQILVCVLISLIGIYIFIMQMWNIHDLWTSVGFVDTWPLYDRLMRFSSGQISLDHYFFDPHVHPHAIIYFLYLMDTTLGNGKQIVPHFATLFSIIGLITTFWYLVCQSVDKFSFNIRSCIFFMGTMILLSGLSEATIIPFQSVVVTTRFAYTLLLAILVSCQFRHNKVLHTVALIVSSLAVTFYASGGIFAAEIILLHLIFFKRWRWLLASTAPLITYLFLVHHYFQPSAESQGIKELIIHMDLITIERIALGVACYYGSGLVAGWPIPIGLGFGTSEVSLITIGFIVGLFTVTWALYTLISLFINVLQRSCAHKTIEVASCLMALLSLSVFASSLAAALLWIVRGKIFGAAMGMSVHYAVLTSSRYAAFASLALIICLFIVMITKWRTIGSVLSVIIFILITSVGLNSMNKQKIQSYIDVRNKLDFAATALLMGMSPADSEANAVWPGVEVDWYWPTQLPKVVTYLNEVKISYAHGLPSLGWGRLSTWPTTIIAESKVQSVTGKSNICRLDGKAMPFSTKSLFAPQRIYPISIESGEVVGYALHEGNMIEGHVICDVDNNKRLLFLSDQN